MMNTYVADDNVTLTVTVKRQLLRDLLCTAVEGGSNYWANFDQVERTETLDYIKVRVAENESYSDGKSRRRHVTADELRIGLERLSCATFPSAGKHLADALTENGDATTADVVLQMTMFGDIIYG